MGSDNRTHDYRSHDYRSHGIRTAGGGSPQSGRRVAAYCLVAFLAAGGSGLMLAGLTVGSSPRPPQPDPDVAPAAYGLTTTSGEAGEPDQTGEAIGLARAEPVRVTIPRIDVDSELLRLGVDDDGEVEVPPLRRAHQAGWYERGVTPGEVGSAVIIGHVDSRAGGPAVFFELGRLRPGDQIDVLRADRSVATFHVDGVAAYPKDDFPAELVYGPSAQPTLRLITCGGEFDERSRDYLDNVVVFATLAGAD